jgi:hypothetical protein
MDEQSVESQDVNLPLSEQSIAVAKVMDVLDGFGGASLHVGAAGGALNPLSEELKMFLREITQQRIQRTPQERPLS